MEKLLPTGACIDELPRARDNFSPDLRLLDQNLGTSLGGCRNSESGKGLDPISLNLSDKEPDGSGIESSKRHRSDSDSSAEDESLECKHNPKLSSVLVRPHHQQQLADEAKRKALMESQRNDKQVFDRNKRMFGMLMGTLKQFKTEETGRERQTIKRSRIEEKLELAVEKERAFINDKVELASPPRQDGEDHSDGTKLDITNRFKNWEQSHRHLRFYIQTQAKPKIFWLPKEHNSTTEKMLKETKDYFSLCVAERTAKLKKELEDFDDDPKVSDEHCQQPSPRIFKGSRSASESRDDCWNSPLLKH